MMKKGLLVLAACALATPALATAPADPFVEDGAVLSLEGLDLTTTQGQRALAIRMDAAANAVCGEGFDTIHLALAAKARECRTEVLANIREEIEIRMAANGTPVQLASNR